MGDSDSGLDPLPRTLGTGSHGPSERRFVLSRCLPTGSSPSGAILPIHKIRIKNTLKTEYNEMS